jgi:transposase
MVYRPISDDLKLRALWLLEASFVNEEVCELFGVSRASLYRWRANHAHFDSVLQPPNPLQGRPRILNPDQTHDLLTLCTCGSVQRFLCRANND